MTTQPQALALADFLVSKYDLFPRSEQMEAAAMLRTQRAAIERKDALLRQALDALLEHGSAYLHHEPQYEAAIDAITKELQ